MDVGDTNNERKRIEQAWQVLWWKNGEQFHIVAIAEQTGKYDYGYSKQC
jgi:hypothetical protein